MKILFLLFLVTLLPSCSYLEHDTTPNYPSLKEILKPTEGVPKSMTRQEVLTELHNLANQPAPLIEADQSPETRERKTHLVPANLFFPQSLQKELSNQLPRINKFMGVPEVTPVEEEDEVDITRYATPIKHQDDGKCTAYSGTAGLEVLTNQQYQSNVPGLDLSDWNAWSLYQQYSADAFIKALTSKKIGDERDYPQFGVPKATLRPYVGLLKSTYIGDDENLVVKSLKAFHPVYLAMSTPNEMLSCKKVISPNTTAASGGHALLITGFFYDKVSKGIVAKIRNSWGADCGDFGYQYMPLSVCHKRSFYCSMWSLESVEAGVPSPAPLPPTPPKPDPAPVPTPQPLPPAPTPLPKVCHRLWYAPWKKVCE